VLTPHPSLSAPGERERLRGGRGASAHWLRGPPHVAGREPISVWLERQLADTSSQLSAPKAQEDDDWDFDSDEHSAASHIEAVADYIGYKVDDEPFFSRANGAFHWLKETVGVDLTAIENRWR
jgi:hypothetical protein